MVLPLVVVLDRPGELLAAIDILTCVHTTKLIKTMEKPKIVICLPAAFKTAGVIAVCVMQGQGYSPETATVAEFLQRIGHDKGEFRPVSI